jgi:hypothetical protein
MVHALDDADWERLVHYVKAGQCTPLLGAGASAGSVPLGGGLADDWAGRYGYPFPDRYDLAKVMQYISTQKRDAVFVKELLVEQEFSQLDSPDFSREDEPHALLAGFDIPVYLTTNYDDFMARALTKAGRTPLVAHCRWYAGSTRDPLFDRPEGYAPDARRPIVYHLHGLFREPRSLVLTEDDYLDFLVQVSSGGSDSLLPPVIKEALSSRVLLFVGYRLQDWTFRVIFRGLLAAVPPSQQRRHISVQLLPDTREATEEFKAAAQSYLDQYFDDMKVSVFWGTAQDFCRELRRRLGA